METKIKKKDAITLSEGIENPQIILGEWQCFLFGNTPESNMGIVYRPKKWQVPNFFVRWMMKICFASTWVKDSQKDKNENN